MRETMPTPNETAVARLGLCERTSPLAKIGRRVFVGDHERVLLNSELSKEIAKQGVPISVIGIPKTIDNDLKWIVWSFGFTTSVEEARKAIQAAHTEACGSFNGIGLVKVMGRHSGFIAVHAGMAGRTNMVVGIWNRLFTNVPIPIVTSGRNQIDSQGDDWQLVIDATGQPERMKTESDS